MNDWARVGLTGLLLGALGLPGCASLRSASREGGETRAEVRPEAPPEYDLLVAQQHLAEGRVDEALGAYERAAAKDHDSAFLHRQIASVLSQQNRVTEALDHAARAVELEPDDEPFRVFLAQLHRMNGDPESAERVLLDESGQPINADAAFLVYQIHLDADRYGDALATARWLVENESSTLRGWVAVANAYQRMGQPLDAEEALREALERDPDNLRIYGALARSLRQRGEHLAEAELYDEVLDLYPGHHATLVALGEAQMAVDDLEGAIATFEATEERYPDDVQTVVRLGYLKFEARRFAEAAGHFDEVLEEVPEQYEIAFFLGVVRRRTGESDAAITAFARIPSDHEHYPEARTQIAAVYERRGDYERALVELKRATVVKSSPELALYEATLRAKSGDLDGAVAQLESLLEEQPDNDELLFSMGVVYGEADRKDRAIEYMERALEKNPDSANALNYIGYTWAEKGVKLDEAEELIVRAIELRPDDGYIIDSLGWVYYMRARPLIESGRAREAQEYIDRALRELERADELTGGDPVISEHLGDTYLLLDQKLRALEKFEEAIGLEPRQGEQPDLLHKFETLQRELR